MRHTLSLKFLLAYAVFGLAGFVFLAVFGSRIFQSACRSSAAQELYREVRLMADFQNESYRTTRSYDLAHLERLDTLTGQRIIILNAKNTVAFDSRNGELLGRSLAFNPADSDKYYRVGDFYGAFTEPCLSVFTPITMQANQLGYVTLHQSLSVADARVNAVLGRAYLVFLGIFAASLLLLIMLHLTVVRPIRAITDGAEEFAKRNLDHRIPVESQDELGYLAKTLNLMAEEIKTAGDYQKKFIANVSHDFRSPLTSIRGYIQAIQDGVIPPEKQDKYMQIIVSETDRLTNMTQSMLALNSLDDARLKLELSDFPITTLVKSICETFEGICVSRSISFDLVFSKPELSVHADMGRIQQVLYNLIDNAVKFSPDGSAIRIRIHEVGDAVSVSVKDRGIGIAKEDLSKIWTRFYKTDSSRGKDKKGTGLGLSIVKEIIAAHGETIDVTSTPGSGTEFVFRLPAAKQDRG